MAAGHFVILTMLLALGAIWLWAPCAEPWQCRLQSANFGITYAFVASQLIMAHMCKEPFEPHVWLVLQLALGAVNAWLQLVDPVLLAGVLCGLVLAAYLHYVLTVIGQVGPPGAGGGRACRTGRRSRGRAVTCWQRRRPLPPPVFIDIRCRRNAPRPLAPGWVWHRSATSWTSTASPSRRPAAKRPSDPPAPACCRASCGPRCDTY